MNSKDLVKEVTRLATEYPDTIYCMPVEGVGCKYTQGSICIEGKLGCLIGIATQNIFPNLSDELEKLDDQQSGLGVINMMHRMGIDYTDKDKYFLSSIQQLQDTKVPWGKALKVALENSSPHTIT